MNKLRTYAGLAALGLADCGGAAEQIQTNQKPIDPPALAPYNPYLDLKPCADKGKEPYATGFSMAENLLKSSQEIKRLVVQIMESDIFGVNKDGTPQKPTTNELRTILDTKYQLTGMPQICETKWKTSQKAPQEYGDLVTSICSYAREDWLRKVLKNDTAKFNKQYFVRSLDATEARNFCTYSDQLERTQKYEKGFKNGEKLVPGTIKLEELLKEAEKNGVSRSTVLDACNMNDLAVMKKRSRVTWNPTSNRINPTTTDLEIEAEKIYKEELIRCVRDSTPKKSETTGK